MGAQAVALGGSSGWQWGDLLQPCDPCVLRLRLSPRSPPIHPPAQVLVEGRAKLEDIVRQRGRAAAAAGDHADVLRYARLTRPLRLQQEGLELLCGFLRRLVADRARADYDALVDSFATGARLWGLWGFEGWAGWVPARTAGLQVAACPVSPATPHLPRRSLCSQRSTAGAGPTIWAP